MNTLPQIQLTENDVLEVVKVNKANEYANILPFMLNMGFPEIYYDGFALQKREFIVYASRISIYNDKEKIVRYSGGYAGASVRIAKGLTIHQGARKGTPIRENVREFIDGDLIITNKRVVFVAEKGNFEFKVDKLTACKISAKNSFILQSGNKSKNIIADENVIKYIVAFINTILNSYVDEVDMYDEYLDSKKLITPELQQAYDDAKKEITLLMEKQKINTINNKHHFSKKSIFAIIFFILFGVSVAIQKDIRNNDTSEHVENFNIVDNVYKKQYKISEIVNIDNHPKIGDSFDSAIHFQKNINDNRIKALRVEEKARIEWGLKKETDDTNVLYLEADPISGKFLGAIEIKIYEKEFADILDVNKSLEIIKTYLPSNFSKHYKKDKAYIVEGADVIKYIYSARLNNAGIDYHNNGKAHYSNYLAFYILHNKSNGYWRIYTNYSAYGGQGLEWIEKYARPWNVNLNK